MFSSACLLLGGLLCAAAPADAWQTVVACRDGNVVVRVKVLPKASLATADWLMVEIENSGRQPLPVASAHYRIERETDDLLTGKLVSYSSLASGNDFDMLGPAPRVLPAGVYHSIRGVSDYSAALLGLPPATGWRVRARFHLTLELKNGQRLQTPAEGVPFTFEWHHPGEPGFAVMRQRLKQMIAAPQDRAYDVYILDVHLRIPEVAKVLARDDLLGVLAGRKGAFAGRESLLREISKRYAGDPLVLAHFRDRLAAGDTRAVEDLGNGAPWDASYGELVLKCYKQAPEHTSWACSVLEAHWDPAHARPLAELVAVNAERYAVALGTLAKHRGDWMSDADLVARVSGAVQKEYPLPGKDASRLVGKELEQWAWHVNRWSLTGDPKLYLTWPRVRHRRILER